MSYDSLDSATVPAVIQAGGGGPRILFFSGGSALNPVARALKRLTRNSIHLVPPFDSGGSSGSLRRQFAMPAVGDLRARMLALVDENAPVSVAMGRLLAYRFPNEGPPQPAHSRLLPCFEELVNRAPALSGQAAVTELRTLLASMAADCPLDLRGASMGNLALAAAYLAEGHSLERAGSRIGAWLQLQGQVHCTVEDDLQLCARLSDGRVLCGQRQITGKEMAPLRSRIDDTWLARPEQPERPVRCAVSEQIANLIRGADLLVYAPGSFHSSLLVHFLPEGVCAAIADCPAPKLYMPNLGPDPEFYGRTPVEALGMLQDRLGRRSDPMLTHLLIDPSQRDAFDPPPAGVTLITEALRDESRVAHQPERVSRLLMELARRPGSP